MGAKIFLAALKGYEKEGVKPKRLLESFFICVVIPTNIWSL